MKRIKLKSGIEVVIRRAEVSDYEAVKKMRKQMSLETIYTNKYPDMPETNEESYMSSVNDLNKVLLLVLHGNEVIGNLMFFHERPNHPWLKYTGRFGMGILKDYWSMGLGSMLIDEMIQLARERGIHRIEAFVREENERAKELYLKKGFVIEGKHVDTAFVDGKWYHNYSIALILKDS